MKSSKARRQASKKGKSRRSANRHKKLRLTQEQDIQEQKEEIAYEARIAMKNTIKAARQFISNEQQNSKGTTK